jgi:predicted O-methyltransferase YrrM
MPASAIFDGMQGDARKNGSLIAAHMPTLYMLANQWSEGAIVELGVNRGWSTVALYAGARAAGKTLISYDLNPKWEASLQTNLKLAAPPTGWEFRVKDSVEAAKDFTDGSVSCWFLDTSHTLLQTRKELAAWLPKIRPDGIMCGHDYLMDEFSPTPYGVKQAVNEFAAVNTGRFHLQVLPHDCGFFILRPRGK